MLLAPGTLIGECSPSNPRRGLVSILDSVCRGCSWSGLTLGELLNWQDPAHPVLSERHRKELRFPSLLGDVLRLPNNARLDKKG